MDKYKARFSFQNHLTKRWFWGKRAYDAYKADEVDADKAKDTARIQELGEENKKYKSLLIDYRILQQTESELRKALEWVIKNVPQSFECPFCGGVDDCKHDCRWGEIVLMVE